MHENVYNICIYKMFHFNLNFKFLLFQVKGLICVFLPVTPMTLIVLTETAKSRITQVLKAPSVNKNNL